MKERKIIMGIDGLTPELQEKIKACKTPEEMLALAQEAGYELSDEQLEGIAGGGAWETVEHFLDHDCHTDID